MTSRTLRALLRAFGVACCALLLSSAVGARAATTRIMALGDSITGSPGCWRALLWSKLQAAGFTSIDMVGSRQGDGCSVPYDGDNEGWPGVLAINMAGTNQLPPLLAQDRPDIVMMHFGTNDVWNGRSTDLILGAYTTLVGQMRAQNPSVKIIVSQIIPMDSARSCAGCAQGVVNLDAAIPAWAAGLGTAQSPITVVDQWTGFDTATDTYDGVHPSDSGNQKIAARLYPALVAALGGAQAPSFALSASPSGLSVVLSSAAASATSTITVVPAGGFTGSVSLSATAPSGVGVGFSSASTTGSAVMTVTVPANTSPGTYGLVVTGTSGSLSSSVTVPLVVSSSVSTYTLSASPATLTVTQGGSATSVVTITRTSYTAPVTLSVTAGLPSGVTASFGAASADGDARTMTLTASATAATGPAALTITGVGSNGVSRSTTVSLTVKAGSGGSTGSTPCANPITFTQSTNNFDTPGAVCYRTAATIHGWGCYNFDGRTLKVNDVTVTCGAALPPAWSDGYTYFAATAGTYSWAGIYAW